MTEDPIVEELHRIREEMLEEHGGLEGLVEERELAVPSDHGRVDAAPNGLGTGADLVKAKGGDRLALPLERQRSDLFGIHSVAKEPVRSLADQNLAWIDRCEPMTCDEDRDASQGAGARPRATEGPIHDGGKVGTGAL